jgi:hypothetical protein
MSKSILTCSWLTFSRQTSWWLQCWRKQVFFN